ncbi:cytochrome P450 [Aspergillus lucknowensis]|uniref:Cytochrome P450 n=1 Tax=Aspergillus lucknowensis TaxID=176173 RepID=A0ABR4LSF0_9EURO
MSALGILVVGVLAIFLGSSSWVIAALCATLFIFKAVYQLILYPRFFTPLKQIQTPPSRHWLTGNSNSYFIETQYELMRGWLKDLPHNGLLRYYIVGNLEWVTVATPEALREMLVTKAYDFAKPPVLRHSTEGPLGIGLVLAEGEEHKAQRKVMLPAFSYRHIKDLCPLFWSKSVEMVGRIEESLTPGDNTVLVDDWAGRATLDIIGEAGLGVEFRALQDPENAMKQAYYQLTAQPLSDKILFLLALVFGLPQYVRSIPVPRNRVFKECYALIRNAAGDVIRRKKAKPDEVNASTDIISVALRSGVFDEKTLIDQAMTFLGAGHETTSTSFQWAVYVLCTHPDIQHRLRDEIRSSLPPISPGNAESISASMIEGLPYLNAFCNELLRFHPPIGRTVRVAVRDTTLVGKHIPKGTHFVLYPLVINRMEELWGPDADTFNPERFLAPGKANTGGATSNYGNMTFLHGPRSCIAQGFAKLELACLVAATVGRFQMELKNPDAELKLRETITLAPKDGLPVRFTALDGW